MRKQFAASGVPSGVRTKLIPNLSILLATAALASIARADFRLEAPVGTFPAQAELSLARHDIDKRSTARVLQAEANSDGSLDLTVSEEAGIFVLKTVTYGELTLAVSDNETIELAGEDASLAVDGSPGTQVLHAYETFRKESLARLVYPTRSAIREAKKRSAPDEEIVRLTQAEVDAYQEHLEELNDFVIENAGDTMALYGASLRLTGDYRLDDLAGLVASFAERLGPIQASRSLQSRMDTARRVSAGSVAPELIGKNPEGAEVALSEFRGRYVLVDFWASWCPPCRVENAHYSQLVGQLDDSEFEIFAVNLDTNEKAWSRAVSRDRADWVHISDLQGWTSPLAARFGVNALPASFLLDPEGRIIAKNLRGHALDTKLRELGVL